MIETNFKHTEIGLIPHDWELVALGEKGQFQKSSINPQSLPDENFTEYSMPAFDDGKHPQIKRGVDMLSGRLKIQGPVLLYNKLNVRQRRIWYIKETPINAICSGEFLPYVSNEVSLPLLYFILGTDSVTNDFIVMSKGTSNSQKRIAPKDFLDYQICLPPTLAEQERIAGALSSIDTLIGALNEQIEKKRHIKQGTMQQLLTGKKRLAGFTGEWKSVKLGELLAYEQPTRYLVQSTEYSELGIPVLTAGKTFILGYTIEDSGIFDKLPVIIFDDFVVESKYVTFPFKVKSSAMKMLSLRDATNNLRFIYEKMQCIDFPIADHKRHWISEYSQIEITIPDPTEQSAIAAILSGMDTEIAALEQKRDKYIAIKSGMMQDLLTGKIRLV